MACRPAPPHGLHEKARYLGRRREIGILAHEIEGLRARLVTLEGRPDRLME